MIEIVGVDKLDGVLEVLKSLPPEIVSKRGGPVKLALKRGAFILRDEARRTMALAIARNGSDSTGTTVASIVGTRGKVASGEKYVVRVKRKTFVNAKGRKVSTLLTANLLEYGSKGQEATPWLRPAAENKRAEIIEAVPADLVRRLNLIVRRLARQNRVPL